LLDTRFYRSAYDDSADLSNAEILEAARAGRLPADRLLNPTEFIQHVLGNALLPKDFDSLGYRVHHPELWGPDRPDWETVLHYVKAGRPADANWDRPLVAEFYRDLYLPDAEPPDIERLLAHRRSHPDSYGSLAEALVRNGWRTAGWVSAFDHQSYVVYNMLAEQLLTATQAVVHFAEHGWREGLAVSADREFDPAYYADLAGCPLSLPPEEVYRLWIETGLAAGAPTNEAGHLRALGLDVSRYPDGFDWRAYLEERLVAELAAAHDTKRRPPGRWDALAHLIEHGVLGGPRPPIRADTRSLLLLAAADRFALAGQEEQAAHCYESALLQPDPPFRLLQHAADQALKRGHPARALSLYRQARSAAPPAFWTWCNGANAALAIGELEEAAAWVLAGLAEHPRSAPLQDALMDIQRVRFENAMSRHIGALRTGRSAIGANPENVGSNATGRALDAVLDLFLAAHRASFGEAGAPLRPAADGKLRVVVLANRDLPQCTFYRVDLKAEQLGGAVGVALQVFDRSEDEAFRSAAATAHVALFYRLASDVPVLRSIAACRAIGVPTVYEVDDLVFDPAAFPDPLEAYDGAISADEHFGLGAGVALFRHAAASCDAAIASTERLAAHMRGIVRSGVALVHRNGLSESLAAIARASAPRPTLPAASPVTLFYGSGTLAHGADFRDILAPALIRLMMERPEVRLVACGHVDAADLVARFPGRVERVPPVADRDAYLSQLMGVDVNLAVLRPGVFSDCKSEIKWLEAAAFCVPSVVSDVEGYRETLTDGVHVVRVPPDPAAWHAALRELVLDPARRAAIGVAARDRALALYSPGALGGALAEGLRRLTRAPAAASSGRGKRRAVPSVVPKRPRLPRVLLANVFFPPQAIGGATRVVRDQAAELLARFADRYEVGVLCGNDEDVTPYRTEAYAWRGVPVWSVGSPHREHMNWIPFDPLMAAEVDAVLDRFQPDLVHAHCIQRLTATALERVAARGIPYLVTAHDAWWVSDHQFLVDGLDRLRMPWEAERFETAHNPHTRVDSWSRRLRLRGILDGAAAVLTVSEAFAAIYRRAGVAKAKALPNGLPDLPPLEAVPPVPGRVRLAYLGGVTAHKGYFVLRRALARGRFTNIDLLVTDHAMDAGEERREMWGTTPVQVIGRVPQDRIGALYGRFEVLCAPSVWPESYGLVTREALHYGKWVVASSRGAVGEDVVPGQNGWVVDVSDPAALPRVLAEIEANPARYARPPAVRPAARTVAQQVDELVRIYETVLRPGDAGLPPRRLIC
jgi:glycosyltransferase involved in cell wall biosynthesis/tetratricopeptide (TPR) repeat protein